MTDQLQPFKHPRPIEFHFPLTDEDLMRIVKGIEYNQITHLPDGNTIHVKIFSSDRVKHISWENWRKICAAAHSNPDLMQVIQFIENENSR